MRWGFLGYWLTTAVLSVLSCSLPVHIVKHYRYNLLLESESLCSPFPPRYVDAEVSKADSFKEE